MHQLITTFIALDLKPLLDFFVNPYIEEERQAILGEATQLLKNVYR